MYQNDVSIKQQLMSLNSLESYAVTEQSGASLDLHVPNTNLTLALALKPGPNSNTYLYTYYSLY